jgi:hypothetical protein
MAPPTHFYTRHQQRDNTSKNKSYLLEEDSCYILTLIQPVILSTCCQQPKRIVGVVAVGKKLYPIESLRPIQQDIPTLESNKGRGDTAVVE